MKTQIVYFLICLSVFYLLDNLFLYFFKIQVKPLIYNILLSVLIITLRKLYRMIFMEAEDQEKQRNEQPM